MSTLERVRAWAAMPVSMDVTTMILRSDGVSEEEIAQAYDAMGTDPNYETVVERGIPTIMLRSSTG